MKQRPQILGTALLILFSLNYSFAQDFLSESFLEEIGNKNIFLSEIPNTSITFGNFHSQAFDFMADQTKVINPYIFKADVNPYFNFFSSPESQWALFAVPRIRIRNFNAKKQLFSFSNDPNDNSLPVRTPSYIPAVKLYVGLFNDNNFLGRSYARKRNGQSSRRRQPFIRIDLEHHSNGQDGEELDALSVYDNPDRHFNIVNGTFGKNLYSIFNLGYSTITTFTNVAPVGNLNWFYRKSNWNSENGPYWKRNISENFVTINSIQAGFEFQILEYSPGLDAWYPKNFVHLKYNHSMYNVGGDGEYHEIQRLTLYFDYGLNDVLLFQNANFMDRLNMELQYNFKFPFSPRGNIFINVGWKGWDDYNIFFEDQYAYANIGISVFNTGKFGRRKTAE